MSIKNILEYVIQSFFTKNSAHENTSDPKVLCRRLNALKPIDQTHGINDAVFVEEKGLIFMIFGHTSQYSSKRQNISGILVYEVNGLTNPLYDPIMLKIEHINPVEITAIPHHGDIVRIAVLSDNAELTISDYSSSEKNFRGPLFRIHNRFLTNARGISLDGVETIHIETDRSRYEMLNFLYRVFTLSARKSQAIKFNRYKEYTFSNENFGVLRTKTPTIHLRTSYIKLNYKNPPEFCQNQKFRLSAVLRQFHALKGQQLTPFQPKPGFTTYDNTFKERYFLLSLLKQSPV